ncbi:MAG TPA: response regulator transcription factor [Longimicrobiales bacterium]|nr:response regulator transcription factor [Longimicrobiales bacterium]
MRRNIRILLADDHTLVAEGLRSLLEGKCDILGIVTDGEALVDATQRLRPDVVITDITMPRLNGLDAIREMRRRGVDTRVVVLTMHADAFLAAEAFHAGAAGYVLKHSAGEELVEAIQEVHRGGVYITGLIPKDLVSQLITSDAKAPAPEGKLTPRQRQILQLAAEGRSMKQVAAALRISRRTAESHKYQLMRTLGVRSTAELVHYAIRLGLIPPPPPGPAARGASELHRTV